MAGGVIEVSLIANPGSIWVVVEPVDWLSSQKIECIKNCLMVVLDAYQPSAFSTD